MATFNPFRTFQRNKTGWMAGLTLLAIISFLFLGVIIQLLGGRGGPGSQIETIAESRRFGKITNFELHRLQESQEALQRFLFVLFQNLVEVNPTDMERMQALAPLEAFIGQLNAQTRSPEQLINIWLVTQHAQEEGLLPDWNDVSNMLKELTGGYLSDAIYNDTLRAVGISHRTVEQLLVRYLRWEQSLERFSLSVSAVSPATRWGWYQRLYRNITIEAAAVPVDSFIDQVGEPSHSQLNALFEQYKTVQHSPMSAESGFVMPTELAFQYVVAQPTQRLLDSITEEELLAFYEENKDIQFRRQMRPITEYPQLPGMMPGSLPFPTPGRSLFPDAPMPADEMPRLPEIEGIPEGKEESTQEETSDSAKVTVRLVSYQSDEEAEAGGTAIPVQEDEIPVVEGADASDEPVDLSVLYLPFDEVKDQIRGDLAIEKAIQALPLIQEKMEEYAAVYHEHFEQGKQPPPMPDLTGFVDALGLELVTVPLGDVYAALRTDLARGDEERRHLIQMFRRVPLLFERETFWGNNGVVLYWVTDQKDEKRPEKLEEVREIVHKRWKEIEARTLAQKKAEELAYEAKASEKSLAEVFEGRSEVPVVETEPFTWKSFGGQHPLMVNQRVRPWLGEVREKGVVAGNAEIDNQLIVAPGEDFMEAVFSMQVGETGVVFNQPKTAVYVVRVTSSSPSAESLVEQFQLMFGRETLGAGQPEMIASAFEAWLDEIRHKTGFRWVNKPESRELGMYE